MKKVFITITLLLCMQFCFAQVSYYKGEWTRLNKQELFTGIFKISKNAMNKLQVEMVWTYLAIDSSNSELMEMYKGKKGRSGIEYAEGNFSASTNDLSFEGIRTDDPFVILGLDKYHLKLSADNKVIYGSTETQGSNEGLVYAIKLPGAAGEKEFRAAKARVKK